MHLIANSQAALWIGDDGSGFIRLVNALESLPYLQVIETVLIGIPLLIHGVWGIKRVLEARLDSWKSDGSAPTLKYERNRAFTWQRLSYSILSSGSLDMLRKCVLSTRQKKQNAALEKSFLRGSISIRLYTLAARLHVTSFTLQDVEDATRRLRVSLLLTSRNFRTEEVKYNPNEEVMRDKMQKAAEEREWTKILASFRLKENQMVAVSSMPGTAFLLMVRNTFKSPVMAVLYTIFVLAAAFHAFNGFWTF